MARECPCELVGTEGLKVACGREVAGLAIRLRERVVGDLADQRLDEAVLAPFGRPGVGLLGEDLPPDQAAQMRLQLRLAHAGHCGEGRWREALAEDRRVVDEAPVGDLKAVEPGRDQRGQRLRDRECREIAGRDVDAVMEREPAFRDQHAHRLHRVERDPVGPGHDGPGGFVRQAGHEPGEQVAHRALRQGLQVDAREVPLAGSPVRALVQELRAGERHDEDRDVPAPLHHVVDEVDEPAVRVVEVLEDHRHRALRGEPFEERPPGAE